MISPESLKTQIEKDKDSLELITKQLTNVNDCLEDKTLSLSLHNYFETQKEFLERAQKEMNERIKSMEVIIG